MIRVALVTPSAALRAGLLAWLESDPEIMVVREAGSLADWPDVPGQIDVIVLAAVEPFLIEELAEQGDEPAILLLADRPLGAGTGAMLQRYPVWGLLSLECSAAELLAAVRALQQGLLTGEPRLLQPLLHQPALTSTQETGELLEPLTGREIEVLQAVAQGLANKQIALQLGISEHTVKFHVSSIYAKLGASNRTEAVRLGVLQGLVTL